MRVTNALGAVNNTFYKVIFLRYFYCTKHDEEVDKESQVYFYLNHVRVPLTTVVYRNYINCKKRTEIVLVHNNGKIR